MPGEEIDDALAAARELQTQRIGTILTHLGENLTDASEAEAVTQHYLRVLDLVRAAGLDAQISVKLTQLGLDLSVELCQTNLKTLVARAAELGNFVWIDMEGSAYTEVTLDVFRRVRLEHANVGVCLQSYLRRTASDLAALLPLGPAIRLVKGAYKEPPDIAFPRKKDADENYFALARQLLSEEARRVGVMAGIATHDRRLIRRIEALAESMGIAKKDFEFEMLYGIQRAEQLRLAQAGYRMRVLISYGAFWFPWFMRRLAERPANVLFVAKNMFGG
jgi:proline dehydrogenase